MISMRFEGGKELAAALSQLSTRLSKKVLISALTEGARPIQKHASSHARRRSPAPDIADNIGIGPANYGEQATVKVGPVKGFSYGLPLELGTVHTAAQPIMRPAFDANVEKSIGIIGADLWTELAGRGINRPTVESDADVEDSGQTRSDALSKNVFKGKQRQRKPRKK